MEFASAQHPPVADHKSLWTWNSFSTLCLSWQIAMVVLFATCVTFAFPYAPSTADGSVQFGIRYAMFQDTHVMMALGFGFLYTLVRFWEGRGRVFFFFLLVFLPFPLPTSLCSLVFTHSSGGMLGLASP